MADPDPNLNLIDTILTSVELKASIFHLGQYCGAWKASTHGLARAGFHVCLSGECWVHLTESGVSHALQEGDAILFLSDVPHLVSPFESPLDSESAPTCTMQPFDPSVEGSTGLACGFFEFNAPLGPLLTSGLREYLVIRQKGPTLSEALPIIQLIVREARNGGDESSPLIAKLVDLLMFYAFRHHLRHEALTSGLWHLASQPQFRRLFDEILENPGRDWRVTTMASVVHMSRAVFIRRFTETTGESPGQFLTQIRMRLASQRIAAGEPISRLAFDMGYQSEAAFSRAFKKITGVQPGVIKRNFNRRHALAA